jgi:hypothetical protein
MKNAVLMLGILFISIIIHAQSDIIYTVNGDSIVNCKIQSVTKENLVSYSKDTESEQVIATAIVRDGTYIALSSLNFSDNAALNGIYTGKYKDHDFVYYNKKYNNAKRQRNIGRIMTFFGFGVAGMGAYGLMFGHVNNESFIFYYGGIILGNLGIPLWVWGGVRTANNREALENIKQASQLSFGATQNGVGFRLKLK